MLTPRQEIGSQKGFHVVGQAAPESQELARYWVFEAQKAGVKRLAAERRNGVPEPFADTVQPAPAGPAVKRIADDGMAPGAQVNADLMGAPGLQPAFHQACPAVDRPQHPVVGDRFPAASGDDGHLFPVLRISADISGDRAFPRRRRPPAHRLVRALQGMLGELTREGGVGGIVLRRHQQSRRILVDPVDDPRPGDPADSRQRIAAMGQQRVDQRPVRIARRRMHHEARRLVHDDQVFVLEDDGERDRLGDGPGGRRLGDTHLEGLAQFDPPGGLGYPRARLGDRSAGDEGLDAAARHVGQGVRQHPVQTGARAVLIDGYMSDILPAGGGHPPENDAVSWVYTRD